MANLLQTIDDLFVLAENDPSLVPKLDNLVKVLKNESAPPEPKPSRITIVSASGRHALYVDGALKLEAEHIGLRQVMQAIGIAYSTVYADSEWMFDRNGFPDSFEEVRISP